MIKPTLALAATTLLMAFDCHGGAFQNLDFEQANPISTGQPFTITAASALPFWTVDCGSVQQTAVFQNVTSTGQAAADIIGPTAPPNSGVPGIIDGGYSVVLQGGVLAGVPPEPLVDTSLQQTGSFPAGDQTMEFKAWGSGFSVEVNGNSLPLFTLATTGNYTVYGVDISAYSGQSATLAFVDPPQPTGAVGLMELDDINFSTSTVPEPSPAILIPLAGLFFAFRQELHRRKSASFSAEH